MRALPLALLPLFIAVRGIAQDRGEPCGTLPDRHEQLVHLAAHFADAATVPPLLEPIAPDASRYVETQVATCARVLERALERMEDEEAEDASHGWEHAIFRYGEYYAVLFVPPLRDGVFVAGGAKLLVYHAADLRYLLTIPV